MMKNLIAASYALFLSASLCAQPAKTAVKAPPKPIARIATTSLAPLKTLNDSASYSIGLSIASFCKQQKIPNPNTTLITRSITDVMNNKPALMNEGACNAIVGKILGGQKISTPKTAVTNAAVIKTGLDSASYAIGANHASFFKQQGIKTLNTALVTKAIKESLGNKPLLFDDRMANLVLNKIIIQKQEEQIKPTIDAGRAFLENNKKRPEVKTTPTGLQYEVVKEGTGVKPTFADTFVCNYKGSLIDGTEFDNSFKRNQPLVYPVNAVIRGWTEGLQLMTVGSKYNFYIPFELGYGPFGSPPAIPGGAVLVFEVELLDVKPWKVPDTVKPAN